MDQQYLDQHEEDQEEDDELKYGATHVILTFKPVVWCMFLVVFFLWWMPYYKVKDAYMIYTPFHEKTSNVGTKVWQSLANSAIVICVIVAVTCIFVLLYKYRCMKIINGWLLFVSMILMFLFFGVHLEQVFSTLNVAVDYITVAFLVFNYAIVGLLVIHWKGPLVLNQAYLIFNSTLFALTLIKYLPDWTTWVLLAFLSVWDLIAVLCPKGPLKALVEMAQERNDYFPSIIYSSTMVWMMVSNHKKSQKFVLNNASPKRKVLDHSSNQNGLSGKSGSPVPKRISLTLVENINGQNKNQIMPLKNDKTIVDILNDQNPMIRNTPTTTAVFKGLRVRNGKSKITSNIETNLAFNEELDDGNNPNNALGELVPNFYETETSNTVVRNGYNNLNDYQTVIVRSPLLSNVHHQNHSNTEAENHSYVQHHHKPVVNRWSPENEEDRGVKIGLGDLVFYSVLVGKASSYGDWNTTLTCFIAILVGLCLTLLLLAIFRKPLPALPISIFFGLLFYFSTSIIITPFVNALSEQNFFV